MISAVTMTVMAWMRLDKRSEIPICKMLAVIVMMAAVCPGGSASRMDIGCLKSACRYESRIAAEIRRLDIRKPSYRLSVNEENA
jgi:hypothetical protein